jgi:tetratricopeptide (TPR) repeat protein
VRRRLAKELTHNIKASISLSSAKDKEIKTKNPESDTLISIPPRVYSLYFSGKYKKAYKVILNYINSFLSYRDEDVNLISKILLKTKNYSQALSFCNQFLKQNVDNPDLLKIASKCHYKLGNTKKAQFFLLKYISKFPYVEFSKKEILFMKNVDKSNKELYDLALKYFYIHKFFCYLMKSFNLNCKYKGIDIKLQQFKPSYVWNQICSFLDIYTVSFFYPILYVSIDDLFSMDINEIFILFNLGKKGMREIIRKVFTQLVKKEYVNRPSRIDFLKKRGYRSIEQARRNHKDTSFYEDF